MNRRLADQKFVERMDVVVCCFGKMVVGKRRIKLPAFTIDAFMHGATERRF